MSDIVERLRERLDEQAADEIERLRAELGNQTDRADYYMNRYEQLLTMVEPKQAPHSSPRSPDDSKE